MKKFLYGMMIFILSFGMIACGGKEESKETPKEVKTDQTTTTNEIVPEDGAVLKV